MWQFCYAFIVISREPYVIGRYFKHFCEHFFKCYKFQQSKQLTTVRMSFARPFLVGQKRRCKCVNNFAQESCFYCLFCASCPIGPWPVESELFKTVTGPFKEQRLVAKIEGFLLLYLKHHYQWPAPSALKMPFCHGSPSHFSPVHSGHEKMVFLRHIFFTKKTIFLEMITFYHKKQRPPQQAWLRVACIAYKLF